MKVLFVLITLLVGLHSNAQEKKITLRLYVSPSICKSPTQYRVFNDGKATLTNLTKSNELFFGGGVALLKHVKGNWFVGGDLAFASKGFLATRDTIYNNGGLGGTSFKRTDLNFLQTTIFIENQTSLNNSDYSLLFSTGMFYGMHIPNIIGVGLEANGNDFGTSLSIGVQRKRILTKLHYQKGLVKILNNANSSFKTNILSFKFGYTIL